MVQKVSVDFQIVAWTLRGEESVADVVEGLDKPLGEVVAVRDDKNLQVGDVVPEKQVIFLLYLVLLAQSHTDYGLNYSKNLIPCYAI